MYSTSVVLTEMEIKSEVRYNFCHQISTLFLMAEFQRNVVSLEPALLLRDVCGGHC